MEFFNVDAKDMLVAATYESNETFEIVVTPTTVQTNKGWWTFKNGCRTLLRDITGRRGKI